VVAGGSTYDVLLCLCLYLRAATGKFQCLQGLRAVFLIRRHRTDDADVRVTAQCIFEQMSELGVSIGDVRSVGYQLGRGR
jgi:hypothetical protein